MMSVFWLTTGELLPLAYNRVGVESDLSLSMCHIIWGKCVGFVIRILKNNEEPKDYIKLVRLITEFELLYFGSQFVYS